MNIVQVNVECDEDCTIEREEFSLEISQFIGSLSIDDIGGNDDISLIKECCNDYLIGEGNYYKNEDAFIVTITLEESGEFEDVFWHKYYKVVSAEFIFDY